MEQNTHNQVTDGSRRDLGNRSKRYPVKGRLPPHQLLSFAELGSGAFETNALVVETAKLDDIIGLLWLPDGLPDDVRNALIVKAIDLFESLKPAEGIEAMLALQMVGTDVTP